MQQATQLKRVRVSKGANFNQSSGGRLRRRASFFAIIAAIVGLVAAYVDGGEEPLHPIVQEVAVPKGFGQNS